MTAAGTQEAQSNSARISPWRYVLTLYLPFGIMNGMLTAFPAAFLKLMDFSNSLIGLFGGIGLISAFRFFYAPWLDGAATKRTLSLFTLFGAGAILLFIAVSVFLEPSQALLGWTMAAGLVLLAFASASHETAADGFYIRALDKNLQAQFIGIKTAAIRIGALTATMGLLYGATVIAARMGAVDATSPDKSGFSVGFGTAYLIAAAAMIAFGAWNRFALPKIPNDLPVRHARFAFVEVLREYFAQPRVIFIVGVILLYRFGEGFLLMKVPFYLEPRANGGLGASAASVPIYTLLTDTPWSIVGGIFGGYLIKWFGLRRTFIPLALGMSLPNLCYVWLAVVQPETAVPLFGQDLIVGLLVASSVESLGYGMSFSALFFFMHASATESGRNKTSVLAISFALLNIGWYLPGMMSGFTQAFLGYTGLFVVSSTVGLLAVVLIFFLPLEQLGLGSRGTRRTGR